MSVIDRKTRLFDNIVRLRRAERDSPRNEDIVAVRTSLESELGETISRRLAARLLDVSHTALARWIKAGDLPIIHTANGREEVPVAALVDLYEAVEETRDAGTRRQRVLEPTMTQGRSRAAALKPQRLVSDESHQDNGHRPAELRSLAYHRAIAPRLRRPMLHDALHLIWQWRDQGRIDDRYAKQWEEVLRKPVPEVRHIIGEDSPYARDLRQNSPFAGMLSEPERRKIIEEVVG
jgi:hypothetical protein